MESRYSIGHEDGPQSERLGGDRLGNMLTRQQLGTSDMAISATGATSVSECLLVSINHSHLMLTWRSTMCLA